MADVADLALKDRICDASNRIPTSRWPFFSTTLSATIPQGASDVTLTFEAERDTLFTDLSISTKDDGNDVDADVSIEYCNTTYADHTSVNEWGYCCQRKPIFLVGVRENKRLKIDIHLLAAAPDADGVQVLATLSGFQGDGCCS